MIKIRKCILLYSCIFCLSNLCTPSIWGLCWKMGIQKTSDKCSKCKQCHLDSLYINIIDIVICHSDINQVWNHDRDKQLKTSLDHDKQRAENHVLFVRPHIPEQSLHIFHKFNSFAVFYIVHYTAKEFFLTICDFYGIFTFLPYLFSYCITRSYE